MDADGTKQKKSVRWKSMEAAESGHVRGQLATQADWGWPGPTVVGLASTVGLASPTKMKTFWVIKYLNIYSTNK